ncbi:MAG: SDR family oxidoreductase [Pseudomonadota bacterium]|jgi:NAD(P)-dependent dehydrogenase (short-subunit alcohol dehydrogenase family)|nr:MAG: NAD(P)-dependent oxidoreductase [Pseudomonadota bacterium]
MSQGVLLVTGGSRGIGEAIAVLGARRGYDVVLSYASHEERARAVVDRIQGEGGTALAVRADTAREEEIDALFAAADARGPLAALVYNAGITGAHSPLADAATSTIDAVLAVNLRGAILCCRSAIRRMSTRFGGRGGSIVLVSSRASFYGSPNEFVWYAASKGGMDSLNNGLAREVALEGIRVNAVSPGPIITEMHRPGRLAVAEKRPPMQRAGTPEEVAEAVLFLASDAASYVTGANLLVSGGL